MLEEWQSDGENLRQLALANKEKQVVLGSLLGNSSIIKPKKSRNPHFQMRESISKGGNWIRCKAHELVKFSRGKSFVQDRDSYRWNSISNQCWKNYHELCYRGNKKFVSMQWLDQLQDYGLACWFLDKGEIRERSLYIRISRFDKKSVENIVKYFEIIGIPVQVKKFGGSKILHFNQESKVKFLKLISHRFPLYYIQQIS
jgi:hypothetical protein